MKTNRWSGGLRVVIGNIPKWNIAVLSGNQKVIFLSLAIKFSTTCFRNPFVEATHLGCVVNSVLGLFMELAVKGAK